MSKRRAKGEGSIYFSDSQKLWVGKITLPDGKRRVKYGKTQKEVKDWILEIRKTLKDGIYIEPSKMTVGELLDRWFNDVAIPRLRESTIQTHETIIRVHLKPAFGNILLSQISPLNLTSLYSEKLKSGLSKRTVKYMHTVMHQALGQALKWGLVARNVSDSVDAPTPDKKKVRPLTKGQVAKLLEVLENDRLYPLYVVYLGCGFRRGEALALTKDCIDWESNLIHIRKTIQSIRGKGLVIGEPKSEASRRPVAMPTFVRNALIDHLSNRAIESEFVFCTSKGTPFTPRNIIRHFKRVLKKAGLPEETRIHDLRHTFVSFLLAKKQPPKDVQVIVGHADFSTTMSVYAHMMEGAQQEAAKKMDDLFVP
jgi:integrase